MVDYAYINPNMLIGGHIHNKAEFDEMCNKGVTHFVCLLWNEPHETLHNHYYNTEGRAKTICVPTVDDHEPKPIEWFEKILLFSLEALSNPNNILYVNCAAGRSRSALAWYAILMALGHYNAKEIIKSARPKVDFWPNYIESAHEALNKLGYMKNDT